MKPTGYFGIKLTAGIFFIMLFVAPSTSIIQDASASKPSVQITSAKAGESNIIKDTLITLTGGKTSSLLSFEFRGFDDTDHIVELQCSFDGINYMKTNCASQSEESQSSFPGSDGVQRNYNVKSGKAYRQVTPLLLPKTYFFGVKVLNDKNELSPAATWTFKMRAVNDAALPGTTNGGPGLQNEKKFKQFTVRFDKLMVYNDHDFDSDRVDDPGEWYLRAFVQGKMINLVQDKVYEHNYELEGKEITVNVRADQPLQIFTLGFESDIPFNIATYCKVNEAQLTKDVAQIFTFPPQDRNNKIYQLDIYGKGLMDYLVPPCKLGQKLDMFRAQFTPGKEDGTYTGRAEGYSEGSDFQIDYTIISKIS